MAAHRARKRASPPPRRFRPQDFQARSRRKFDAFPLLLVAALAAVGWWLWRGPAARKPPYDVVLKSTDRAVVREGLLSATIVDEGQPLDPGAAIQTRQSEKTVLSYGPNSAIRLADHTELTVTDNELDGRHARLGLKLQRGRAWLVAGNDTEILVSSPLARVRPTGRVTEVRVADDGTTTVTTWQGSAELWPEGHPDRKVLLSDQQEASYDAQHTITDPHPLTLTRDDPWLSWNLLETMHRVVHEKPASKSFNPRGRAQ